ncbi:acyl-CoA dehydrogenase family protein [Agromyces aerolatus]|uniref:acyl-CoA dehydrogenase family protein n=1 Tax=Agromyces sp. LY-1074 TaxID=3074080 RepID=UPI002862D7EA|nr:MULTISPECIES: acyl-CoA dehydrogenase family protein [unclassified Agromyces]MDR5699754.1 acyl-CoA dehydrogenase family protein [Agromyces sp. LY-1074]MDR5706050.1 acyl-CoA dehydrogenase family protein [Agromyces sp. LY-1358]
MDFSLTEDQTDFQDFVRAWTEKEAPKSWARELEAKEHDWPHELWDKLSEAGFMGIGIPEEYGGQGGDVITQVILARGLARTLGGLAWVWGIPSFAGAKSVGLYGSPEQKERYLPKLAAGEEKWAIGFTEPGGGTDVLGAMRTTARKVDGGWVLNGQKTWSSMSHVADHILLLARTDQNVEKRHQGLTLFILPAKSEGVTIREIPKLGMRALGSCDVFLDDVFVPDDNVLGEPNKAWYMLLPTLNNERIVLSALCLGAIDAVLEDSVRYMHEREAFGGPIARFQVLQHYVADMAMAQAQTELMIYRAAWMQSQGIPNGQESNMAKVIASEHAGKVADLGLQILGGMGYSAETDMQRYWRDVRLFRIGPITNEMARNTIAEGLGLPRSF